jgi:putative chitinase
LILVDYKVLRDIAPHVSGSKAQRQRTICDALSEVIAAKLDNYEINTYLRVAHFLSQTCHESDGFCTTEEYASGAAYEGRADLGNTVPGDGHRFKGRGLFQLTGRANYRSFGAALGLDLITNPAAAAVPDNSLVIACEYWKRKDLNRPADKDDILTITKRINGGLNGIESRRTYLTKAKVVLGRVHAACATIQETTAMPVLLGSSKGEAVANLQPA